MRILHKYLNVFVWRRFLVVLLSLFGFPLHLDLLKPSFSLQQGCTDKYRRAVPQMLGQYRYTNKKKNKAFFTILKDLSNAIMLVFAPPVSLHVRKDSALVCPEIVFRAKEEHGELSDLMTEVLDVGRDVLRVTYLCRPPSRI